MMPHMLMFFQCVAAVKAVLPAIPDINSSNSPAKCEMMSLQHKLMNTQVTTDFIRPFYHKVMNPPFVFVLPTCKMNTLQRGFLGEFEMNLEQEYFVKTVAFR